MAKNEIIIPADWEETTRFHGFTKDKRYFYYVVQIRALGSNYVVARTKSIIDAARTYDAALWKLLPFTPACIKPNFPEALDSITQTDVDNLCPYVNRLYDDLTKQVEADGLLVETLKEARAKKLTVSAVATDVNALNEYQRLVTLVNKIHFHCATDAFNLTQRTARVSLMKLPTLSAAIAKLKKDLEALDEETRVLKSALIDHAELFQKFRNL